MRLLVPFSAALLFFSCDGQSAPRQTEAPLLAESDAPPRIRAQWPLFDDASMRLDNGRLWLAHGGAEWAIADQVMGVPAIDREGTRLAYCRRSEGDGLSSVEVWARGEEGDWDGPRVLDDHADRPALSPDGRWVVYVSGRTGIASLWVVPFEGGDAIQLTNVGLEDRRAPGHPPEGFVAPPHEGPPRFEGTRLVWKAPDGNHTVDLP